MKSNMAQVVTPFILSVIFCLVFSFLGVRAIKTGYIQYRGGEYNRDKNPIMFWLIFFVLVTGLFASFIIFVSGIYEMLTS